MGVGLASSRYSKSLKKLAVKTGRPYKQLQQFFAGDTDSLYKIAAKSKPNRALSKFLYEQKISRYRNTLGNVSREVAVSYVRTIPKYTKTRLETRYIDRGEKIDSYTFKQLEKSAKYIRTGPNAGKFKVYYDRYNRTPLTVDLARRIRTESRSKRIARFLKGAKRKDLRKLKRYFTPADYSRIQKRGYPTNAEAERAAKKIAKRWGHKLFVQWQEIFGGPSP